MTMRSALWKRDASSRIFPQAVTLAGVIGSPETLLYFAFIVSASNSGSHSCQTSSVSTTMSSACVIYSRRKAPTRAREADCSFRGEVTMLRTCMISPFGCTAGESQTPVRSLQLQAARTGRSKCCASGLLSRGFEDQPRDLVGMGDQREMAGLHLDGLGAHALAHEAFEIRIDRPVFRGNGVETWLRPPRRMRGFAREQSLLE